MPTFLRFPFGGDMLVNTDHIVSVHLNKRTAEQKDVDRAGDLFEVGQTIYLVRLQLPGGCNSVDLEYPLEETRDAVYEEIVSSLKPIVIIPPTTLPPTPKAPRKPRTRKPRE